jgi:hypothetical protein
MASLEPKDGDPASFDCAMRDMECAIEVAASSRLLASQYRQLGFHALADFHRDNAKGAERWLVKAGQVYPLRCDSLGHPIKDQP